MVVEADESDGTCVKLPAVITIVTNMDAEHLDRPAVTINPDAIELDAYAVMRLLI